VYLLIYKYTHTHHLAKNAGHHSNKNRGCNCHHAIQPDFWTNRSAQILYLWRHEIIKSTGWIHLLVQVPHLYNAFCTAHFRPCMPKNILTLRLHPDPGGCCHSFPMENSSEGTTPFWVCRREVRGENSDNWLLKWLSQSNLVVIPHIDVWGFCF